MEYYLIFLNKGIVVSICRYDDEEVRDSSYKHYRDDHQLGNMKYDELQVFNEID